MAYLDIAAVNCGPCLLVFVANMEAECHMQNWQLLMQLPRQSFDQIPLNLQKACWRLA